MHPIRFPDTVAVGSRGGPGYRTDIIELADSGQEERVSRFSQPRHRYDCSSGIKKASDLAEVIAFYHAVMGAGISFPWKDWRDFSTASDHTGTVGFSDVQLGLGDGSRTTFQLIKKYVSGPATMTRNIYLPVAGTLRVAFDGVEQVSGWTVNSTTGILTFTSPPGVGVVVSAGFQFDVPCRFTKEADELLDIEWDEADNSRLPSIPIVEVVNETALVEEFFYGGAKNWGNLTGDQAVAAIDGRVQRFDPQSGGFYLLLPDPASYPLGGPWFYFINANGTNSLGVKNELGISIGTIPTSSTRTIILAAGVSGNTWLLY